MAPIDIVQAQAEVASNESGRDRRGGGDQAGAGQPAHADSRSRRRPISGTSCSIRPTRRRSPRRRSTSTPRCATRSTSAPDLRGAKNSLEQSDINIKYFTNQIKPDVNAQVNYSTTGVGGTQLSPVDLAAVGARPPSTGSIVAERGFGSVLGDVFTEPVSDTGPSACRSAIRSARTPRTPTSRASKLRVRAGAGAAARTCEMQVVDAGARRRRATCRRTRSACSRRARRASCRRRSSRPRRRSSPRACRRPSSCSRRSATSSLARTVEIQAISDYNKSLVDFEAVQQVPINGSGGQRRPGRSGKTQTKDRPAASSPSRPLWSPASALRPQVHSPGAEALGHGHHQERSGRSSARRWRRSPGPTRSSSSTRDSTDDTVAIAAPAHRSRRRPRLAGLRRAEELRGVAREPRLDSVARRRRARDAGARRRDPATLLAASPRDAAFRIPRVTWHLGRWIRTTDWYPDYQHAALRSPRGASGPAATCTRR